MNLKMLTKSFVYFSKLMFIKKEYDVIFVYLNHFNRGENGTNLFLNPFFEICKKNDIKYEIFEDTDLKGAYNRYPRNNKAIPLDFITLLRVLLRKFWKNKYLNTDDYNIYYEREKKISLLLKKIFLRNLEYKVCINMAGDTIELFRIIAPNAILCEYQHGLVGDAKHSVIYRGIPNPKIKMNNVKLLVYGKGFVNTLSFLDKTNYYDKDTVVPIGYSIKKALKKVRDYNSKKILFTLENTQDFSNIILQKYIKEVELLLTVNKKLIESLGYKIIYRNHPRYNPDYQINIKSQAIIQSTSESIFEDLEKVDLVITFHSTSVFDAALLNIPTILINTNLKEFSPKKIYLEDYKYPLKQLVVNRFQDLSNILEYLINDENYKNASQIINEWSNTYYQDFNEKKFLALLGKK